MPYRRTLGAPCDSDWINSARPLAAQIGPDVRILRRNFKVELEGQGLRGPVTCDLRAMTSKPQGTSWADCAAPHVHARDPPPRWWALNLPTFSHSRFKPPSQGTFAVSPSSSFSAFKFTVSSGRLGAGEFAMVRLLPLPCMHRHVRTSHPPALRSRTIEAPSRSGLPGCAVIRAQATLHLGDQPLKKHCRDQLSAAKRGLAWG